jgi:3-isopropylmalate/(R)-2-methylmalate dehydratase large subunit
MEERMTVCNMSIEAGARAGMIAPDETTYSYLKSGRARPRRCLGAPLERWRTLPATPGQASIANSRSMAASSSR